jgi:hypothetical protein
MDNAKSRPWPQTPAGVTDWEKVFEHPKAGFIVLISSASTAAGLKECTTIVVQQLFTRDNDTMLVMKFIIDLENIIPDQPDKIYSKEELDNMRQSVTEFLRKIKKERVTKAKEFLAKQSKQKERRVS